MPVDFGKWKSTFSQADWVHINTEARRALGNRLNSIVCRISRDTSGRGVIIDIQAQGSPGHAPFIHLSEDIWRQEGEVRCIVREALADADDPGRVERATCVPLN